MGLWANMGFHMVDNLLWNAEIFVNSLDFVKIFFFR